MDFTDHTSTLVTGVLMFFIPALIALLRSRRASSAFVAGMVFAACFLGALLSMLLTDTLIADVPTGDPATLAKLYAENLLTAITLAHIFYKAFYQPTGIADKLERIGGNLGEPTPTATDWSHKPPVA